MVRPYRYYLDGFPKGMVSVASRDAVPDGALYEARNVLFTEEHSAVKTTYGYDFTGVQPSYHSGSYSVNGDTITTGDLSAFVMPGDIVEIDGAYYEVASRDKEKVVLTSSTGLSNAAKIVLFYTPITRMHLFTPDYGQKMLVFQTGNKVMVYGLETQALETIATVTRGFPVSFATYMGYVIIVNGIDTPKKYDGREGSTPLTQDPVQGRLVCVSNDKVFLAGDPKNPSMLYFSATGEIDDFHTAEDAGAIFVGRNDGSAITAIVPFQYRLVIFKENSIWVLSGRIPPEFVLEKVTDFYGCVDPDSVVVTQNGIYFLSSSGYYVFTGGSIQKIDTQIENITIPQYSTTEYEVYYSYDDPAYAGDNNLPGWQGWYYEYPTGEADRIENIHLLFYAVASESPYGCELCLYNNRAGVWDVVASNTASPSSPWEEKQLLGDINTDIGKYITEKGIKIWIRPTANTNSGGVNVESQQVIITAGKFNISASFLYEDRYYAVKPDGTGFIYDSRNGVWSLLDGYYFTGGVEVIRGVEKVLFGALGNPPRLVEMKRSLNEFDGVPIKGVLKTGFIEFGDGYAEKIIKTVSVKVSGNGYGKIRILTDRIITEEGFAVNGDTPEFVSFSVSERVGRGMYLELEIDGDIVLNGIEVVFLPVKVRR